jgi:hypothetical protein
VLSKSPAAAHGLAGLPRAWMPELRQRRSGCPSPASAEEGGLLSGDFLLVIQERVTRAPKAHESSCFKVALKNELDGNLEAAASGPRTGVQCLCPLDLMFGETKIRLNIQHRRCDHRKRAVAVLTVKTLVACFKRSGTR